MASKVIENPLGAKDLSLLTVDVETRDALIIGIKIILLIDTWARFAKEEMSVDHTQGS